MNRDQAVHINVKTIEKTPGFTGFVKVYGVNPKDIPKPESHYRPLTPKPKSRMKTEPFVRFIIERHRIWERREHGEPKPWTQDPILQVWKFCNVYRELDTVTRWIANNWREPHCDEMDLWFALVIARFINWPDSLEEIGYPVPWNPKRFVEVMNDRQRQKKKLFTGAYMIHADLHYQGTKAAYLAEEVFAPLWRDHRRLRILRWKSLAEAHDILTRYRDMGDFMAGQVIADLKYVPKMRERAPDWWTWAAPGPGSLRGLNRILERPTKAKWNNGDWFHELTKLRETVNPLIERQGLEPLHAQDLQNCLCEWDKYRRVETGEGTPRSKYPGLPASGKKARQGNEGSE